MSKVRVRVEVKKLPISVALRILKKKCTEYGIPHELKEHEFFVRKCDKRRRKRMHRLMMARQEFVPEQNQQEDNYNA
jgi:ribosomal protein S21